MNNARAAFQRIILEILLFHSIRWLDSIFLPFIYAPVNFTHISGKSSSPAFEGLTQFPVLAKILGDSFLTEHYSCPKILEKVQSNTAHGDIMSSNNKAAKEAELHST